MKKITFNFYDRKLRRMKSRILLFIFFYLNFTSCVIRPKYYCIDDDQGKSCQNKLSANYQYLSQREFEKSAFTNTNNIYIYTYVDIAIKDNILLNNDISKLTISSNQNCQVSLNANKNELTSISFNNVKIFTELKIMTLNSIKLVNSAFINDISIISNSFISDSFSLKSFVSIQTEKLELIVDQNIKNKPDIFIVKGSNYHLFNQHNPQVLIYNSIDSNLIFGTNYINFNNLKIISQIYPFIEIKSTSKFINLNCHSKLIPNVLLTPIIHMISGKCNCFGTKWPQIPKKINSYWEFDTFYEANDRQICVILESSSSIHLYGKKIPISIKSNGFLSIYCESIECGISGQIYTQTPNDQILSSIREKVTFSVNSILRTNNFGYLHSKSSNIHIIINTCFSSSITSNLSNYLCNSIYSDLKQNNQILNLAENGNFIYDMKMNTKTVFNHIKSIISLPPLGDVYNDKGSFNLSAIIDYGLSKLKMADSTALLLISSMKTLGNSIVNLDYVKTKGKHKVRIKRNDILINSLFYYNLYKYNRYLVCSTDQFNMNDWQVEFDDYKDVHSYINIPFFEFNETNISYITRNYQNNETTYCLQMKVEKYPNSAIEFLLYTNDKKLEGKFTWLSGVLFNFVSKRKLSGIRSVMSNPNSKNIVFFALNDLVSEMNMNKVRNDANVMIIGASLNIIDELKKGFNEFDFDIIKPKIMVSYSHFNSIAYLFCKLNDKNVSVNNFIGIASDILNINEFELKAKNVVFDLSTWKQIQNNGKEYKFKNFILIPFEFGPSIHYKSIEKVEFLRDKWRIHFENYSAFDLNYSVVSDELLILSGVNKNLTLKIDESFDFENKNSILKPIKIGYDILFDNKMSNFSGIPHLLNNNNNNEKENLFFIKMFKSFVNKVDFDNNDIEKVVFEGEWNKIKDLENNFVYTSNKKNLKIENFPIHLINKIYFQSKEKIVIKNVDQNSLNLLSSSSQKVRVKNSFPMLINGNQQLEVPQNIDIEFENITILSKKSSFKFNKGKIQTDHFKSSTGSSCNIKNISITKTIELEPNSFTIFESSEFSNELKIEYFYSLEKRFPLLVLKSGNLNVNSIILNHISNEKILTDDEILSNYSLMPQIILKIKTKQNECEKFKNYFSFNSDDERFKNSKKLISLFCHFSDDDFTVFGLNITVDVVEGQIDDFDLFGKKKLNVRIVAIICFIIGVLVIFTTWGFLLKKIMANDEANEPLNSINDPPLSDINSPTIMADTDEKLLSE